MPVGGLQRLDAPRQGFIGGGPLAGIEMCLDQPQPAGLIAGRECDQASCGKGDGVRRRLTVQQLTGE